MNSIDPKRGEWHETEVVMPYLESNRCLGAVNLQESDLSTSGQIVYECVDGFVTQKVRDQAFKMDGLVGDVQGAAK